MLALRTCSVVVMCSLSAGCILDETTGGALSSKGMASTAATGQAGHKGTKGTGFVPREPGISASRADQTMKDGGAAEPSADPPAASVDAATQAHAPMQGARVQMDAGTVRQPDAQVTQPPTPSVDATPMPIHRYDFSGRGNVAVDSIGDADGELRGDTYLDGTGAVQFVRAAEDAVALPSGILAGLSAFTVIGWLELRSDDCWQHLVDFTYYNEQPAPDGSGRTSSQMAALYLTPRGCPDGFPIAGYVTEQGRSRVTSDEQVVWSRRFMLGMMYESTTHTLSVIVDGVVQQQASVPINLRELARSRCTLGHSYYPNDPTLNGSVNELRIYAEALDDATLAELARRGPDQL